MDYVIIFFFILLLLILLIFGLPFNQTSLPQQITKQTQEIVRENFSTSPRNDIEQGASTFYDWAKVKKCSKHKTNPTDEECEPKECPDCDYTENKFYIQPLKEVIREKPDCNSCDITKMSGIDKYVLKSSVPACPDMSKYALKSMIKNCPDMSEYIKKTEVPVCPTCPDLRNYVPKSSIPAQIKCPVCPVCPICPPSYEKVEQDPKVKVYINNYEKEINKVIENNYITKQQCKTISHDAFKDGVNHGKKTGMQEGEMKGFERGIEKYYEKIQNMPIIPQIKPQTFNQPTFEPTFAPTQAPTLAPITLPPTTEEREMIINEFKINNPTNPPTNCDSNIYTFDGLSPAKY